MVEAVQDTVYFKVTVRSRQRGSRWSAIGLQTGFLTYGETRKDAEQLNADTHIAWVTKVKEDGRAALDTFMRERAIVYTIGDAPAPSLPSPSHAPPDDTPSLIRDLAA